MQTHSSSSVALAIAPPISQRRFVALAASILLIAAGTIAFWATNDKNSTFESNAFAIALAIGVIAQLVDGALGMAYGITATSALMATGVPPVAATASVHISEAFTTAASGLSHWRLGNIDRALFKRLVLPGVIGAIAGVLLITSIDGKALRPWIAGYLLLMGAYVIFRAFRTIRFHAEASSKRVAPLAFTGAFVDAVGGGGWGPVVTTTLLGSGHEPRRTIGSVNSAEFFVTLASGFSFALLVGVDHWEMVAGLMLGGMLAAPFAARVTRRVPAKALMVVVGLLIAGLSVYNLWSALR